MNKTYRRLLLCVPLVLVFLTGCDSDREDEQEEAAETPRAQIALWRNTHAEQNRDKVEDGRYVKRYYDSCRFALQAVGLPFEEVTDEDVAGGALSKFRFAILPLNPSMPPAALTELKKFMGSGGKLFVFYSQAEGVADLLGVRAGRLVKSTRNNEFQSVAVTDKWPAGASRPIVEGLHFFQSSPHAREVELGSLA